MKNNLSFGIRSNDILIIFSINAFLLTLILGSMLTEVNGLSNTNSTLPITNSTLPVTNSNSSETSQNGTIASIPGSLDSDRRHMPLI